MLRPLVMPFSYFRNTIYITKSMSHSWQSCFTVVSILIMHNVGQQSFQKIYLNPPSPFKGQQSNSDIPFSFSHPGQKNIQMWPVEVFMCQSYDLPNTSSTNSFLKWQTLFTLGVAEQMWRYDGPMLLQRGPSSLSIYDACRTFSPPASAPVRPLAYLIRKSCEA